ncbi:MAG: hypothetical protein WCT37_02645 [Patescibacteria group bacterium]|jgi:hypothetical protein
MEDKQKVKLVAIVAGIMIFVVIGWLWSLKYSLFNRAPSEADVKSNQQWQEVKSGLGQSFQLTKEGLALIGKMWQEDSSKTVLTPEQITALKNGLLEEATKRWVTYSNFDYNFTLKYPEKWDQATAGQSIIFTENPDEGNQKVVITVGPDLARPEVKDDQIENFWLDNLGAKLYHTATAEGAKEDVVAASLPGSKNDIVITGYGEEYQKILLTFKFIK